MSKQVTQNTFRLERYRTDERCQVDHWRVRSKSDPRFLGFGFPPIIYDRRTRSYYLAREIVDNLQGDYDHRAQIKYGPGGRRHYCLLTERLVESLDVRYERIGVTEAQLQRNADAQNFAVALIDLLPGKDPAHV